jgi:serine/threonine protein kinase
MDFLSLGDSFSLEQGLLDPSIKPCSNLLRKKSQKIQNEEIALKTAVLALCHYGKVLHGLQDAKKAGCVLDETIQLPPYLHEINDYIFFLGEDFHDFKVIGKGAWGKVSKCSLADKTYAIKTSLNTRCVVQNIREPEQMLPFDNDSNRDIYIPLILSHPNLIKICGIFEQKPILEYIKDGSLEDKLSSRFKLSDQEILSILSDIAHGLSYLHKKGLIHKDIKPANILLEKTQEGYRPVICDFGTTVSIHAKTHHYAGTEHYLPPEMACYLAANLRNVRKAFNETPITFAMDVWAFGHVLYQMISGGRHLFVDRAIGVSTRGNPLHQKYSTGCATICYSLKETYTFEYLKESCLKSQKKSKKGVFNPLMRDKLLHITSSCLQKKAENRPSMEVVFSQLELLK